MKRIPTIRLASFLPLVVTVGFFSSHSELMAQSKLPPKPKSAVVASALKTDKNITTVNSTSKQAAIVDKQLSPVSAQVAAPCAPACNSNCTTTSPSMSGGSAGAGSVAPDGQMIPSAPLPTDTPTTNTSPNTTPGLTDPSSVFSAQTPAQTPAAVAPLTAGQEASTAMSYVPAFMGDFFAGSATSISNTPAGNSSSTPILANGAAISIPNGSGVGIMKLAENTSPLPRDRVFLSYNYYQGAQLVPGGTGVNRFTPGVEKTFFNGNASVEVRVPMALTLSSNSNIDQTLNPTYDTNQYELGNVTTFFKALLFRDEVFALSTGLGVAAPTADDTRVRDANGNVVVQVSNQAWHLLPFIGSVYTPTDRLFFQSLVQVDVATNNNSVYSQADQSAPLLIRDGAIHDTTYLFASVGGGYWFYESANKNSGLTRASLISEFHFNSSVQPSSFTTGQLVYVGNPQVQSQVQNFNAVLGTNLQLGPDKSLLLGYVSPLGSADRGFAGEFRVLFNWYFGGSANRANRVQF